MQEDYLPDHAPLWAYLKLAEKYYNEDRLDVAMKVVEDAFKDAGWPSGDWSQFFNNLTCEKDARDSALVRKVDSLLSIEIDRGAGDSLCASLGDAAVEARRFAGAELKVEFARPAMVTIFRPDAPIQFIQGPYGYVTHKTEIDKICLPWIYSQHNDIALHALRHEFVHVAVHELAGEDTAKWLNEGLASYLAKDFERAPALFSEASEALGGGEVSMERVEDVLSTPSLRGGEETAVREAYYLASTFIAYWVSCYTLDSVREVLVRLAQDEDPAHAIHHVTGTSLDEMERQWANAMLNSTGTNQTNE